jgi:hypothetical protein
MRRVVKVKALATRVPLRKTAMTASAASRRGFPAWIADDEGAVAFPAKTAVTPRVRDGLVLRIVSKKKVSGAKGSSHANSTR